jgi:hypothetical protein
MAVTPRWMTEALYNVVRDVEEGMFPLLDKRVVLNDCCALWTPCDEVSLPAPSAHDALA